MSIDLYDVERLARAATDLGHYNMAKLLRAAGASIVNRRLYGESLPKTDANFRAALSELVPALEADGLDPDMLAVLRLAGDALIERGIVTYRDVPPLLVCRVCGEAVRGHAPEYCPTCGAGETAFQDFPIIYYLEPEPVPIVLGELAQTPGWLDRVLADLTPEQAARKVGGAEGEWSLMEAAGHLLGAQALLAHRVQLFLASDLPDLAAQNPQDVKDEGERTPEQAAQAFRGSRTDLLAQLRTVSPALWLRVGRHSEFGPMTLQQQVTYFAKHEQWHMAQMTRIRKAVL